MQERPQSTESNRKQQFKTILVSGDAYRSRNGPVKAVNTMSMLDNIRPEKIENISISVKH